MAKKICVNCHAEIDEKAKFCIKCGASQPSIPIPEPSFEDPEDTEEDSLSTEDMEDIFSAFEDDDDEDPEEDEEEEDDDETDDNESEEHDHSGDSADSSNITETASEDQFSYPDQELDKMEMDHHIVRNDTPSESAPSRQRRSRRRRVVDEEEPEDKFDGKHSKSLTDIHDDDEYKETKGLNDKLADQDAQEDISQNEGRKHSTNQKRERRKKQRQFDENKHYHIEQDSADDDSYDNYYETVKTIDCDEEKRRNGLDKRTIIISALLILLLIGMVVGVFIYIS